MLTINSLVWPATLLVTPHYICQVWSILGPPHPSPGLATKFIFTPPYIYQVFGIKTTQHPPLSRAATLLITPPYIYQVLRVRTQGTTVSPAFLFKQINTEHFSENFKGHTLHVFLRAGLSNLRAG